MSMTCVIQTMDRIKSATTDSPIAVFTSNLADRLDSVFANTVISRQKMRARKEQLVGVFHNEMELEKVETQLRHAVFVNNMKLSQCA